MNKADLSRVIENVNRIFDEIKKKRQKTSS